MLIGLVADTHIPEAGPDIWPQVYDRFREERVDAILHGGDMHVVDVLDRLEQRVGVPVYACRGNGDDGSGGRPVAPEDPRLRRAWVLDWEGFRIGLCHDAEEYLPHRPIEAIMQQYFDGPCDIVVCGDTHVAGVEIIRDTLVVNPGSPVYPRNMNVSLGNIGFLRLEDGVAEAWVEPLHPAEGPALCDGGVLEHHAVRELYPDQWVMFAVHGHDYRAGVSHGAVVAAGFAPEEAPSMQRTLRRRHASAILLAFHTGEIPPRGAARTHRRRPRV
jgi:putative phosphoesterase